MTCIRSGCGGTELVEVELTEAERGVFERLLRCARCGTYQNREGEGDG